jgi:hypothetical protein
MKIYSILVTRYHEAGTGSCIAERAFKSLEEAQAAVKEHARDEYFEASGSEPDGRSNDMDFRKLGATNFRLLYSPEAGVQYQIFTQDFE